MTGLPRAPRGYFDAVGGLEMAPATARALSRANELGWADPIRAHQAGRQSALLAHTARASLAASLTTVTGVELTADQIFLAPTMSVAASWAIPGFRGITQIMHSPIETLALLDACQETGLPLTSLTVDALGHVDVSSRADLSQALLVIQAANIEIGTIQDLSGISSTALPLLLDATAIIGRAPVPAGWSVLLGHASSWGGPAGVTVIAAHPTSSWGPSSLAPHGWVSDGSNVPAIVAAATALESLLPHVDDQGRLTFELIEHLRTRLSHEIADVAFAGDPVQRVPHILNCSVLYVSGEALVSELDRRGFAVASGSACVADSDRASHVLVAIGAFTGGNLRISLPFNCTIDDVDALVDALVLVVGQLRAEAGA
ncbi:MAG: aminotransferase class V-fold PLP-dependent enzyme [Candidatus Nanopelagicales bacterium]|nr:aminotransferase class V-fold PLP-dependent enzyme [Candidatus Nanopelagicales bacterium]